MKAAIPSKKCTKCNKNKAVSVAVGGVQVEFCKDCYIKWMDYRDDAVGKSLNEYLKKK